MKKKTGLLIIAAVMVFSAALALSSCGIAGEEAMDYSKTEN